MDLQFFELFFTLLNFDLCIFFVIFNFAFIILIAMSSPKEQLELVSVKATKKRPRRKKNKKKKKEEKLSSEPNAHQLKADTSGLTAELLQLFKQRMTIVGARLDEALTEEMNIMVREIRGILNNAKNKVAQK